MSLYNNNWSELYHHGIKGQKWGVRRYQNKDGTLTTEGKKRAMYRARVNANVKTTDDANRIVSSISNNEKKLLGATEKGPWINQKEENEVSSVIAKRFIQKRENRPVSMLEVYDNNDGVGRIALATDSAFRGRGYASQNIQKAKRWFDSKKNKTINVLLWSAHKSNLSSQKLALANGFKEVPGNVYGENNFEYKYYAYGQK